MNREQFERVVDAANFLLKESVIVIGSQSILGYMPNPPAALTVSIEADILPTDDPDESKMDLIDAMIGEASEFQALHGVYGQGVSAQTPVLPEGWRDRLVDFETSSGAKARCLELHDVVVAKLVAGREKDYDYCSVLIGRSLVDIDVVRTRLSTLSRRKERIPDIDLWLTARPSEQPGPEAGM